MQNFTGINMHFSSGFTNIAGMATEESSLTQLHDLEISLDSANFHTFLGIF